MKGSCLAANGSFVDTSERLTWLAMWICVLAGLPVLIASSTPFLGNGPRALVLAAFETLCHQDASRSFQFRGIPFAVCHRCLAIYVGLPVGVLHGLLGNRLKRLLSVHTLPILFIALAPLLFDWGLAAAGIWTNTTVTRVLTGFLAGMGGGLFLGAATFDAGNRT